MAFGLWAYLSSDDFIIIVWGHKLKSIIFGIFSCSQFSQLSEFPYLEIEQKLFPNLKSKVIFQPVCWKLSCGSPSITLSSINGNFFNFWSLLSGIVDVTNMIPFLPTCDKMWQTARAWFPVEAVTNVSIFSFVKIVFDAPRSLNEFVIWRCSSFK